jgi:hypothetical protein
MTPTFSIVIPTYNRGGLVRHSIGSVLRQTYSDFEVVVSDNHSTDETAAAIASFADDRLRVVRPDEHCVMPDHWEFARRQARGELILLLGDDDALAPTALESFARARSATGADFLFSTLAEYYDPQFGDDRANSLVCLPFDGTVSTVPPDDLLGPLYRQLRQRYRMDPSAFVFSRALADRVADRTGRFFNTQGAEYYAWPLATVFAGAIGHVSLPLLLTGRTPKSWGTNMVLRNPGQEQIDTLLGDVITDWKESPVSNFTFANLMLEGLLAARAACPEKLAKYEVDENALVTAIHEELQERQATGVDVSGALAELRAYVASHGLHPLDESIPVRARKKVAHMGYMARQALARRTASSRPVSRGFRATGSTAGFDSIEGAAELIGGVIEHPALSLPQLALEPTP